MFVLGHEPTAAYNQFIGHLKLVREHHPANQRGQKERDDTTAGTEEREGEGKEDGGQRDESTEPAIGAECRRSSAEDPEMGALLPVMRTRVYDCSFSPDGRSVAAASFDKSLKVWSWDHSENTLNLRAGVAHPRRVVACAFTPSSKAVVTSTGDGDCMLRLFCAKSLELLRVLKGHTYPVLGIAFVVSSTGGAQGFREELVTAGTDNSIRLWDIEISSSSPAVLSTSTSRSNEVKAVENGVTVLECSSCVLTISVGAVTGRVVTGDVNELRIGRCGNRRWR